MLTFLTYSNKNLTVKTERYAWLEKNKGYLVVHITSLLLKCPFHFSLAINFHGSCFVLIPHRCQQKVTLSLETYCPYLAFPKIYLKFEIFGLKK